MSKYYSNSEFEYHSIYSALPVNNSIISFIDIILKKYPFKNNKILDIGCGTGSNTHYLSQFSNDITGIDCSKSAINIAKNTFPLINFTQEDIVTFASVKKFDFIIDTHTMHCIADKLDRSSAFKNIYNALSTCGIFALETIVFNKQEFDNNNLIYIQGTLFKKVSSDKYYDSVKINNKTYIPYRSLKTTYEIENELIESGFQIVFFQVYSNLRVEILSNEIDQQSPSFEILRVICKKIS